MSRKRQNIKKRFFLKKTNYLDFREKNICDDNSLYESIKNLERIKSKVAIENIIEKIKPHLNESIVNQCFNMLLKKTTQKHLKVYLADLLIEHCNINYISYDNNFHARIYQYEKIVENRKANRKKKKFKFSISCKNLNSTVSNAYGKPGVFGKLISNSPRS